MNKNYW